MIEIKHLGKSFGNSKVLQEVNMTIEDGHVFGLIGPNGAGKTTLIKHLAGVYRPDEGEILVDGQPVWENPPVKEQIVAILDDWYYFPQASVKDMKEFYKGIYPTFSEERFEKLKQIFPFPEKHLLRSMSKGMKKQVAFWLAISCMPKYLLLDEPADGLDPVMRKQIWSLILSDVADRKTTVLVSSHNLRELEDVCDSVGILNKGTVLDIRTLDFSQNLEDLFIEELGGNDYVIKQIDF